MNKLTVLDVKQWAGEQFGACNLGDVRRTKRAVHIAEQMAIRPGESIPRLFDTRYEIKAAYDFFGLDQATPDCLQNGHRSLVNQEIMSQGTYLLIEDTATMSWSGKQPIDGLGPIGDNASGQQGFFLHSVMAVRWLGKSDSKETDVEILGILDQQYFSRTGMRQRSMARRYVDATHSDVETRVWERTLERRARLPTTDSTQWVRICDRGADIFEVLQKTMESGVGFVIRACRDRVLENSDHKTLFSKMRCSPSIGSMTLSLRARPQQKARITNLSISIERVNFRAPARPGRNAGMVPGISCGVIRLWERESDVENPLEWMLLCSDESLNLETALIRIQQYQCRWLIEDFHKSLKTGLQAERLQLESAHRLYSAVSLMSVVAVRLLALREDFRINPEGPASASGLSPIELKILEAQSRRRLLTIRDVALAIGRLGGHMNRKSDGMPGLLTLWRGFNRLRDLMQGALLFQSISAPERFGV